MCWPATSTPPAISSTRITSLLLTPHDELGKRLELRAPTACLALEELACSDRREPLLWSWDVVLPGGFEIEVLQSAVTVRPDRVAGGGPASAGGLSTRTAPAGLARRGSGPPCRERGR